MKTINKQRLTCPVIIKVKSSPAGIDWQMIRSMKKLSSTKKAVFLHTEGKNDA